MELKRVVATISCETEGGKMEFTVEGSGRGQSMLTIGRYIGAKVDEHVGVLSGRTEKQAEIDALKAKLARMDDARAAAEQQKADARKLQELERLERMRTTKGK